MDQYHELRGDCVERYALIEPFLRQFRRKLSLIDVGANDGYFGLRAHRELGAVAVLLDKELHDPCDHFAVRLQHTATAKSIAEMARGEHFDVALLLSVLHHFDDWLPFLQSCMQLAPWLVVEYPTVEDTECKNQRLVGPQQDYLDAVRGVPLGRTSSFHGKEGARVMKLIATGKSSVSNDSYWSRRLWISGRPKPRVYQVHSDMHSKFLQKTTRTYHHISHQWVHGINLWTYIMMGGRDERLPGLVRQLHGAEHGDIKPWNMVFDGRYVRLIDWVDRSSLNGTVEDVARWLDEVHSGPGDVPGMA